jgi:hypothetical protein
VRGRTARVPGCLPDLLAVEEKGNETSGDAVRGDSALTKFLAELEKKRIHLGRTPGKMIVSFVRFGRVAPGRAPLTIRFPVTPGGPIVPVF